MLDNQNTSSVWGDKYDNMQSIKFVVVNNCIHIFDSVKEEFLTKKHYKHEIGMTNDYRLKLWNCLANIQPFNLFISKDVKSIIFDYIDHKNGIIENDSPKPYITKQNTPKNSRKRKLSQMNDIKNPSNKKQKTNHNFQI